MEPKIFISYKRVDKEKVFKIKDFIEKQISAKTWIDLDGIESDAQFVNVIIQAINRCEIFLFMYSSTHSAIVDYEKDWTVKEINFASKKGKRIVFINIDNTPLTDWFEFTFGTKQQVDGTSQSQLLKLCNDLNIWLRQSSVKHNTQKSNIINGHEYVDLGLPSGLKWATCNIGAKTPKEPGEYFAWGETQTKATYYQTVNSGRDIEDFSGNELYDVARKKWGATWRMPTSKDFQELIDCCKWELISPYGDEDYKVTGPNGNSLILPAAGGMGGGIKTGVGEVGEYWSSTPSDIDHNRRACHLYFTNSRHKVETAFRNDGQTIRAVSE